LRSSRAISELIRTLDGVVWKDHKLTASRQIPDGTYWKAGENKHGKIGEPMLVPGNLVVADVFSIEPPRANFQ